MHESGRHHAGRRVRRALLALGAAVSAGACADAAGPDRSPEVLTQQVTQPSGADTTQHGSNPSQNARVHGTVIDAPSDSTASWRAVGGVRLELGRRDPETNTITAVAAATSDAGGQFAFENAGPTGLLYVRAVPSDGTYRATRWLAAYALVDTWIRMFEPIDASYGPYVVLERAAAPERAYAPVLLAGFVHGDAGRTAVPGATVVIERMRPAASEGGSHAPPTPDGPVASARTDANGFFLITLPAAGLYGARVTVPAGSPFKNLDVGGAFTASANAETSVIGLLQIRLDRP